MWQDTTYIIMSSLYKKEYLSHYSSVVNRLPRCEQLSSRVTTDVFTYAFKHNDIFLFCSILFHLCTIMILILSYLKRFQGVHTSAAWQ